MKLSEYIKHLTDLIADDEALAECDVVYSVDDEGNAFKTVSYLPESNPAIVSHHYVHIIHPDDIDEYDEDEITTVVCLN